MRWDKERGFIIKEGKIEIENSTIIALPFLLPILVVGLSMGMMLSLVFRHTMLLIFCALIFVVCYFLFGWSWWLSLIVVGVWLVIDRLVMLKKKPLPVDTSTQEKERHEAELVKWFANRLDKVYDNPLHKLSEFELGELGMDMAELPTGDLLILKDKYKSNKFVVTLVDRLLEVRAKVNSQEF